MKKVKLVVAVYKEDLSWEEDHFVPYFMERTWLLLYDLNIKTNKDYLNSPYFYKYKELNNG